MNSLERRRKYALLAMFGGTALLLVIIFAGRLILHDRPLEALYIVVGSATLICATVFMLTSFRLAAQRMSGTARVGQERQAAPRRVVRLAIGGIAVAGNGVAIALSGRVGALMWLLGGLVGVLMLLLWYRDKSSGSSLGPANATRN